MSKVASLPGSNSWVIKCPACEAHERFIIGVHELNDRWTFNGDEDEPTFSPSLLVTMEDGNGKVMLRCHSFITDGKIRYLDDCTHAMAGQTVDLPDIG